jgi:omega-amidase
VCDIKCTALPCEAHRHAVSVWSVTCLRRACDFAIKCACCWQRLHERELPCRKTHLFDIDIPGKITFRESDTLSPGGALTCVRTRFGTVAVGICYDLRFPELAALYRRRGAQLLVFPGAFNMTTGPLHWRLLQQARALDGQLFVASCSPARDEGSSYVAWGHSLVAGPFGEVLGELGHEEGILCQEIDVGELETWRTNMPLEQQRRSDLYELVDKC